MYELLGFICVADYSTADPQPEGPVGFSRSPGITLAGLHFTLNRELPPVTEAVTD